MQRIPSSEDDDRWTSEKNSPAVMKAGVCFVYTVERHIHTDCVISDCLEIIHGFKI